MSKSRSLRLALIAAIGGELFLLLLLNYIAQVNTQNSSIEPLRQLFADKPLVWGLILVPISVAAISWITYSNFQETARSRQYFKTLFHASPLAIVTLDLDHHVIAANPKFESLYGYSQQEIIGLELDTLITSEETGPQANKLTEGALSGKNVFALAKRKRKDGSFVDVEIYGVPFFIDGQQIGVLGLYKDVSARVKAETALAESEKKYREMFQNVIDFLYTHDMQGNFLEVNPAFEIKSGFDREALLSMSVEDLMPKKHKRFFQYYLSEVIKKGESQGILHIESKSGEEFIAEYKNSIIYGPQGPIGVRGSAHNISERIELEIQLKESLKDLDSLARTDALTGVFNRRGIYEHLDAEVKRASRQNIPLSVALVDLDKLKNINDNYGHMLGDEALKVVTSSIESCIRNYDRVGRHGGDEFLAVLPGANLEQAKRICQRMAEKVANTKNSQKGLNFSVSIGLASFFDSGDEKESLDDLLARADDALYIAKESGGNQVVVSSVEQNTIPSKK